MERKVERKYGRAKGGCGHRYYGRVIWRGE